MIDVIKSKNILWVDIAKFIAMFLVVLEHVVLAFKMQDSEVIGYIRNVIVTFHMPVFFFISGYLYKQRTKHDNYVKILYSLAIPYLIYQFLYLPLKLGYYISYENISPLSATIKCFVGILLGDNLGTQGSKYALSVCPACWFIMVMIQLRLIFSQINITQRKLFYISIISIISLLCLNVANIDLYFCLDNTLYAIPYFTLGYYIKNYGSNLNLQKINNCYLVIVLLLILQLVYFIHHNFHNLITIYLCGFIGIFFLITFSKLWKKSNVFINIIAKNTLFLIFFQSLFLFITKWIKLYDLMNDIPHTSIKLLFVIFYSFFIYVISYYIILLIEKCKLEILLGKKFISKGNVK